MTTYTINTIPNAGQQVASAYETCGVRAIRVTASTVVFEVSVEAKDDLVEFDFETDERIVEYSRAQ